MINKSTVKDGNIKMMNMVLEGCMKKKDGRFVDFVYLGYCCLNRLGIVVQ
tara:strand:+ start:862 stop:1011 length:150 start_codon:yes stop_codon:yes gene_type:complete